MYIDTSVLVSYYCPEPNSELIEQTLLEIEIPAISPLTEVEIASAISKKIRERELSLNDGNRILAQFQSHLQQNSFLYLPIPIDYYSKARDWIVQFNTPLRTLDALHLAIASTNNLTILTADIKLASAASHLGLSVNLI